MKSVDQNAHAGYGSAVAMSADEYMVVGAEGQNAVFVYGPTVFSSAWLRNATYTSQGAISPQLVPNAVQNANYSTLLGTRGWTQLARLVGSDASGSAVTDSRFGASVAIMNDMAIVGAPLADAVFVFSSGGSAGLGVTAGWTQRVKLVPAGGENGVQFGACVATSTNAAGVDGAMLAVSAFSAFVRGAVYMHVYSTKNSNWTQEVKLSASDGAIANTFGSSIALASTHELVAVGASGADSVYIFTISRTGAGAGAGKWSQQAVLKPTAMGQRFGCALAFLPRCVRRR